MFEILYTLLFGCVLCILLLFLQIPKPIIKVINKLKKEEKIIEEVYDPNSIIINQELFKLGAKELFLSWKLRHIILKGNIIKYYSVPYRTDDSAIGEFDIKDCLVRKADVDECFNDAAKYTFIVYSKPSHKFVLVAPNEKQREKCIALIEKQIDLYRKHLNSKLDPTLKHPKPNTKSYPTVLAVGHANRFSGNMVSTFRRHNYTTEMEKWMSDYNKMEAVKNQDVLGGSVPVDVPVASSNIDKHRKHRPKSVFISSDQDVNYNALVSRPQVKTDHVEVKHKSSTIANTTEDNAKIIENNAGPSNDSVVSSESNSSKDIAAVDGKSTSNGEVEQQNDVEIPALAEPANDSTGSLSASDDCGAKEKSIRKDNEKDSTAVESTSVSSNVSNIRPIRRFSTLAGQKNVVEGTRGDAVDSDDESICEGEGDSDSESGGDGTGKGHDGSNASASWRDVHDESISEETEIASIHYLPIANYNKEYDAIAAQYEKFFQTRGTEKERIVFTARIGKKNPVGITYYRQLFLTNTPRMFYVEPKSMVLRGVMQWTCAKQLIVEMINTTTFTVSIPGDFRSWKCIDSVNGAAVWVQAIQNVLRQQLQQHSCK